ncbi:MAG: hypothetical protein G01um101470_795 [Parcubacteria group bacterium Gr01-1014_70]|nr:MAG: hypothetical protein G01um101470_795 [Parcubacteria group bacterium Gr01-1014_70]
MDPDCGRCLSADCRGNPPYIDPECPVHGKKQPTASEIENAIKYFEQLEAFLDRQNYDPASSRWHDVHQAAKHGRVLRKALTSLQKNR